MKQLDKNFLKLIENIILSFRIEYPQIPELCDYYITEYSTMYKGYKMMHQSPFSYRLQETELIKFEFNGFGISVIFKTSNCSESGCCSLDYVDIK